MYEHNLEVSFDPKLGVHNTLEYASVRDRAAWAAGSIAV
jgi:hypothetical protein